MATKPKTVTVKITAVLGSDFQYESFLCMARACAEAMLTYNFRHKKNAIVTEVITDDEQ